MDNFATNTGLDISLCGKTILNWSKDKQKAAKIRLWKEFGCHNYLDDGNLDDECEKLKVDEWKLLLETFNVRNHFIVTLNHKRFIRKSFLRFKTYFESLGLKLEDIDKHDDSKLTSFLEIIGYTQRWIWKIKTDAWEDAWKHHYTANPHHPEYYLHVDENGETFQDNMRYLDLVESVIDMVACRWERQLKGREDVTNDELLYIEEFYFTRYTASDRIKVAKLINQLSNVVKEA